MFLCNPFLCKACLPPCGLKPNVIKTKSIISSLAVSFLVRAFKAPSSKVNGHPHSSSEPPPSMVDPTPAALLSPWITTVGLSCLCLLFPKTYSLLVKFSRLSHPYIYFKTIYQARHDCTCLESPNFEEAGWPRAKTLLIYIVNPRPAWSTWDTVGGREGVHQTNVPTRCFPLT